MESTSPPGIPFDRLQGLPADARQHVQRALERIVDNDLATALASIDPLLAAFPTHPELLRICALIDARENRVTEAISLLRRAAEAWPDDALTTGNLGAALAQAGALDEAKRMLERATALDPRFVDAWVHLARIHEFSGKARAAYDALCAAIEVDPEYAPARILRADASKTLGRIADAEADLRSVLRDTPESIAAWVALVNLKSFEPGADDLIALDRLYTSAALSIPQRIDIGFSYAQLLERAGRYERAFDVFTAVNAAKRRTLRWDAAAVSALIDRILVAFASEAEIHAANRGDGVVFLVGMPRSGSTLAEQILAAHPEVRAGGETGLIAELLQRESQRRGQRFPSWVEHANESDWQRLGTEYLDRIAARRQSSAVFTDKTPTNWQTIGAIRRMLPAARIVHCMRDTLETAWSCYKHHFARDQLFSYDFAELAAFLRDERRAMHFWSTLHARSIHRHAIESLLADPRAAIEQLLAHCGLVFDVACLRFHEADREVRTASAAQVREKLRDDTAVTRHYGALLDPLRKLLPP